MGKISKATKKYAQRHKGSGDQAGGSKGSKSGSKALDKKAGKGKALRTSHRSGGKKKGSDGKASSSSKRGHAEEEADVKAKPSKLKAMDVDAFLDGGFEDIAAGSGSEDDEGEQGSSEEGPSEEEMEGSEGDEDDGVEGDELQGGDSDGGDEEDSEDSDEEESGGKGNPVAADNKRLKGEVARHKEQLEALRQKDPEFYAYLQQTDANLLGFGEGEDDDSDAEGSQGSDDEDSEEEESTGKKKASKKAAAAAGSDDEDDEEMEEASKPSTSSATLTVTTQLVSKWCAAAKADAPLGTMKQLVRAYRIACHYGDSEEEIEAGMKIASGAAYNAVLMFMLREADGLFKRMLGLDKIESGKGKGKARELTAEDVSAVASGTKWRKVGPLIKSYIGNSLHALAAMTDAPLMAFTLRRLRASAALMTPQPLRKFGDKLLKACLTIFGSSEEATPRLQAFLAIRSLSLVMPAPFMDKCLRGVYRSYLSNSKFVSASSAPHIAFMQTCAIELWGLDLQMSYAHAFSAIRQLAVSLRGALNMKTKDGYKEVYSWQGVNALELWARVLGAHADKAELRPLVYPLTQLLVGAARLVPTPRFFPLRLRLLRATHRLAVSTAQYVPLSTPLLEMLNWAELHKPPKAGAGAPLDLSLMLRAGKNSLRTSMFQEEIVTQVVELLTEHLAQWSYSPAFPELSLLPVLNLRRFAKTTKVDKFRKKVKALLDTIEKNKVWVGTARDSADFAPKDITKAAAFLARESAEGKSPLAQHAKVLASRAAQRAAARSTEALDFTQGKGKKRSAQDDDDSSSDEDRGPKKKTQNGAAQGESSDDASDSGNGDDSMDEAEDSEEEEKEAVHKAKKAKKASTPLSADMLAAIGGFGDGEQDEVLGQYELSDDDDSDEDTPKKGKGVLGLKSASAQQQQQQQQKGKGKGKGAAADSSSEEEEGSGSGGEEMGSSSEGDDTMDGGDGYEESGSGDSAEIMGGDSDEEDDEDGENGMMKGGWGSGSEGSEGEEEEENGDEEDGDDESGGAQAKAGGAREQQQGSGWGGRGRGSDSFSRGRSSSRGGGRFDGSRGRSDSRGGFRGGRSFGDGGRGGGSFRGRGDSSGRGGGRSPSRGGGSFRGRSSEGRGGSSFRGRGSPGERGRGGFSRGGGRGGGDSFRGGRSEGGGRGFSRGGGRGGGDSSRGSFRGGGRGSSPGGRGGFRGNGRGGSSFSRGRGR